MRFEFLFRYSSLSNILFLNYSSKNLPLWSFLVAQQGEDLVLSLKQLGSLLWCGLDPWPRNFYRLQAQQKKKKKKETIFLPVVWDILYHTLNIFTQFGHCIPIHWSVYLFICEHYFVLIIDALRACLVSGRATLLYLVWLDLKPNSFHS